MESYSGESSGAGGSRLKLEGDLGADAVAGGTSSTSRLSDGVKQLSGTAWDLRTDGKLTPQTVKSLNVPLTDADGGSCRIRWSDGGGCRMSM